MARNKMKYLIIEDEIPAQRLLKETLEELDFQTEVVECLNSITSAVEWFQKNDHPDIVLLDIQLSDGLSFEIFKQVKIESMIIFTTAYDEYAMQAFKVNSLDYLLKPIEKDELQSAFEKYEAYNKQFIEERWYIPDSRVLFTPFMVDDEFFAPEQAGNGLTREDLNLNEDPIICSVGLEFRDYPTLLKAVKGIKSACFAQGSSCRACRADFPCF